MNKQKYQHYFYLIIILGFILFIPSLSWSEVHRIKYQSKGIYLVVEIPDDDLIHFEYGKGQGPAIINSIITSPMVNKSDYSGSKILNDNGNGIIETNDIRIEVNKTNLMATIIDKTKNNLLLTTISPLNLDQEWKGISGTRTKELDVYGLGQQFIEPGKSDIDWDNRVREGGQFGNVMPGFNGGANGNTQIPVMYAVNGATYENYALFLDNKYKQKWDFTGISQWKVEMFGEQVRFYFFTGNDLLDLRKDYMELVGRPLVPPKKMFGLWLSEYGYDNWNEIDSKLTSLRANKFPVDGFVLDLQWFGGIKDNSENTRMGSLRWDTQNFPNPSQKLSDLKNNNGIGLVLIEESYVGKGLPEYTDLNNHGCLVKDCVGCSLPTTLGGWWGRGGMIDHTNESCADYWHDTRRQPLINDGILGHWTDLGEPEMYNPGSGYADGNQSDAHNLYNFKWINEINRGYIRNNQQQRTFIMSRSGAAGIQRFGASMWSGDIASRLTSLASHAGNQMHMSFSGIDYYGADIGGFHRNLEGDLNEMYTQWYAYGAMFDLPVRPHTENLCNCKQTAPDRIGDLASNLENTRQRYELIPYLYSLAHRAYLYGEPFEPPLVIYYQNDINVRSMANEKLIGRDLLAAVVAKHGEEKCDVYLPAGKWFDYYTNQEINSIGEWLPNVPEYRGNRFKLPLYAREGAIVPMLFVDDKTMNAMNKRSDNSTNNDLVVRIFASDKESEFTLYEDDGETIAYQKGLVRLTKFTQKRSGNNIKVSINKSIGTYSDAPDSRNNLIRLVEDNPATNVTLNSVKLTQFTKLEDFNAAASGWINSSNKTIMAKSGIKPVESIKDFSFELKPCSSKYRSISVSGWGNGWNPADPNRTLSCEGGVIWKGQINMANEVYKFNADGTWVKNWGANGQLNGPNFTAIAAGTYQVTFNENDPSHPLFTLVTPTPPPDQISAKFICENGITTLGNSVYIVGSIDKLGNWKSENAIKLDPNGPYPKWTGVISNLPANTKIEWKCVKRPESGGSVIQWEPGNNNIFTTLASGVVGEQIGTF